VCEEERLYWSCVVRRCADDKKGNEECLDDSKKAFLPDIPSAYNDLIDFIFEWLKRFLLKKSELQKGIQQVCGFFYDKGGQEELSVIDSSLFDRLCECWLPDHGFCYASICVRVCVCVCMCAVFAMCACV